MSGIMRLRVDQEWTKKDQALLSAASEEDEAEVQRLLGESEPPRKAALHRALSVAVDCHNLEVASFLLSNGAEIYADTIISAF